MRENFSTMKKMYLWIVLLYYYMCIKYESSFGSTGLYQIYCIYYLLQSIKSNFLTNKNIPYCIYIFIYLHLFFCSTCETVLLLLLNLQFPLAMLTECTIQRSIWWEILHICYLLVRIYCNSSTVEVHEFVRCPSSSRCISVITWFPNIFLKTTSRG